MDVLMRGSSFPFFRAHPPPTFVVPSPPLVPLSTATSAGAAAAITEWRHRTGFFGSLSSSPPHVRGDHRTSSPSGGGYGDAETMETIENLCIAVRSVLENDDGCEGEGVGGTGLSPRLVRGLLLPPETDGDVDDDYEKYNCDTLKDAENNDAEFDASDGCDTLSEVLKAEGRGEEEGKRHDKESKGGPHFPPQKRRRRSPTPTKLLGLPRRPYYREIARRLFQLSCISQDGRDLAAVDGNENGDERRQPRPLVEAEILGMKELDPPPALPAFSSLPSSSSSSSTSSALKPSSTSPSWDRASLADRHRGLLADRCALWFRSARDSGVLALLGLRRTVATEEGHLPPERSALLHAANVPHRPGAKPPLLTAAGRARCKHAHRGSVDQFFGVARGSAEEKNADAERILADLLNDAAWINIHTTGGIDRPVLEVRASSGYGARWTADWSCPEGKDNDDDNSDRPRMPRDVIFRGFLEPQMEDGHEKQWRH